MFLRAQKVSNAKSRALRRNSHARDRFFLIFRLFTQFSELSDTRIVFSGWFSIGNDILDMVFQANEVLIAKNTALCGATEISPNKGPRVKNLSPNRTTFGQKHQDFRNLHPRKRKIQWFPPLPLKFPTGPLVGSSTISSVPFYAPTSISLIFANSFGFLFTLLFTNSHNFFRLHYYIF